MVDRDLRVKTFSYTDEALDELEAALSHERLSTYLDAAGRYRASAIRLHAWNTAVSSAFYGPLQGLELALRNAMHRRLAERYGPACYDHPGAGLDRGAVVRIAGARSELARDGRGDDTPRVVEFSTDYNASPRGVTNFNVLPRAPTELGATLEFRF